jgi:hypothetical protein
MKKLLSNVLLFLWVIPVTASQEYRNETVYPVHAEAQFRSCVNRTVNIPPRTTMTSKLTGWNCVTNKFYFVISFPDGSKRRVVLDEKTHPDGLPAGAWWFTFKNINGTYYLDYMNESSTLSDSKFSESAGRKLFDEYMAPGATSYINKPQ